MLKRNYLLTIIILIVLQLTTTVAKADHSAGGELVYEHISGSQYHFIFKFYRDCTGIGAGPVMYMCAINTCDGSRFISELNLMKTLPDGSPNGKVLGNGCPNYPNTCVSPTSTLPAYQEWWYDDTVTLQNKCTDWTFTVAQSSRNTASNISNVGDLVLMATINNVDAPTNSSPYFSVPPVPFVCLNSPYTYNNGVVDKDGDSLVFLGQIPITFATCNYPQFTNVAILSSKTPPLGLPGNPFQTNNTYTLNQNNGNITFTPGEQGPQTVSMIVREYRNGKIIGSVMRDIQVQVLNCTTPPVAITIDQNSIKNGRMNQGNIEVCANEELEFCFDVASTDLTAVLATSDNHTFSAPNSTITYSNYGTNRVRGCFKWKPTDADSGLKVLTVSAKDSTCRAPGIAVTQTFTIPLYVVYTTPPVVTSPLVYCINEQVPPLTAKGTNLMWYETQTGGVGNTSAPTPSTSAVGIKTYYVTQELNGCSSQRYPILVETKDGPKFNLTLSKDSVCWYEDVMIYNNTINTVQYNKSWSLDSGFIRGSSVTNDTIVADWSKSGYRKIKLTMSNAVCYVSDSIDIYVKPTPVSYVDMKIYGCLGEEITLTPYKNDAPTHYYWQVDEQQIYDTNYVPTYKFTWNSLGKKRVWLYTEGENGCKGTIFDTTINIHDYPVADIQGPDFNDICYGKEFELSSEEGLRYKYEWTPPLAFIDYDNNKATVRAEETGYLYLKVSNIWDCSSIDSFYIDARPCCDVLMPDAFTPNRDGLNDTYRPLKATNHTIVSFSIYNRWGRIVYKSKDISKGWDGTHKGTPQDMGTYYYLLEYLCNGNEEQSKKGNFILIR